MIRGQVSTTATVETGVGVSHTKTFTVNFRTDANPHVAAKEALRSLEWSVQGWAQETGRPDKGAAGTATCVASVQIDGTAWITEKWVVAYETDANVWDLVAQAATAAVTTANRWLSNKDSESETRPYIDAQQQ